MSRIARVALSASILLPFALYQAPAASGHGNDHDAPAGNDGTDVCIFTVHNSPAEKGLASKPSGVGGGGGGKGSTCSKTYAKWTATVLDVYVDNSGAPSTVGAAALDAFAHNAFAEWACHSGIGESVTVNFVASSSGAEITLGWGNLGTTGILGQTSTSYFGGVISRSSIVMNNNQSAFSWTEGPAPSLDADGCAIEVGNGNTASSNYDFLSVLTHEIGHSIGISHPNNRCSGNDPCYPQTMYSCTDAEEFMRRALNPGDVLSVASLYGTQQ